MARHGYSNGYTRGMMKTELPATDVVTLMAALAIATERFPDATEYEAMRQQILKSSRVVIETPERESACQHGVKIEHALTLADGCTCGQPAMSNCDGSQFHFQACRYARLATRTTARSGDRE